MRREWLDHDDPHLRRDRRLSFPQPPAHRPRYPRQEAPLVRESRPRCDISEGPEMDRRTYLMQSWMHRAWLDHACETPAPRAWLPGSLDGPHVTSSEPFPPPRMGPRWVAPACPSPLLQRIAPLPAQVAHGPLRLVIRGRPRRQPTCAVPHRVSQQLAPRVRQRRDW